VLAATNRPAALDAALVRPGRLDLLLYVPPPDAAGRLATLRIHTRGMPLAPDVDLPALARPHPPGSTRALTGLKEGFKRLSVDVRAAGQWGPGGGRAAASRGVHGQ